MCDDVRLDDVGDVVGGVCCVKVLFWTMWHVCCTWGEGVGGVAYFRGPVLGKVMLNMVFRKRML